MATHREMPYRRGVRAKKSVLCLLACMCLLGPLVCVLASGCEVGRTEAKSPTTDDGARVKERTVSIELLRTSERVLTTDPSGMVSYQPVLALGGVEICVVKRRNAFALLQPFQALGPAICATNVAGKPVRLAGVPADSDLLVTYVKQGYRTVLSTFRTDEFDVALPTWGDNSMYFTPLLRSDASLPVESQPQAQAGDGLLAIWVDVVGDYGTGNAGVLFGSEGDPGTAQGEDVKVVIEDTHAVQMASLQTRRDRPLFVSLPPGPYRLRFTHPIMELTPSGVQEQFMTLGLPTDNPSDIEVSVTQGFVTLASVDGFCPLPADPAVGFSDLATCTLQAAPDAGAP